MLLSQDVLSQTHGLRAPRVSPLAAVRHTSATLFPGVIVLGAATAPLLSLLGWIGLMLPSQTALHQVAPTLLLCALLGLALAIIGAHLVHSERARA